VRIANVNNRLKLLVADDAVDVETASSGRFGADPQAIYDRFEELRSWADTVSGPTEPFNPAQAGPPAPAPRQVFAIGLNYADHAAEAGLDKPTEPPGVGMGRTPPRYLAPGDELHSWIEGLGELHQRFVAAPANPTASSATASGAAN
jgi:2-keto-4-pentenoate hydratase/2-oxohepta-3-ene-1,7-dioic acid hydratase in catechol pathway